MITYARLYFFLVAAFLCAVPSQALVNPRVQPETFYKAYRNVVLAEVIESSKEPPVITLNIREVAKGELKAGARLRMRPEENGEVNFLYELVKGQSLVIFSERNGPRMLRDRLLIYTGGGSWLAGRLVEDGTVLEISGNADAGKTGDDIHYGVFNGRIDLLWQMCKELTAGNAYFPSIPFIKFSANTLATLEQAPTGIAVWDLNGDGAMDFLTGTATGIFWFENTGEGFQQHILKQGVETAGTAAIALAPLEKGLGVLHGNTLYRLVSGELVMVTELNVGTGVITNGFADMNNDGKTDIIFSLENAGLRVFLNSGDDQFEDASQTLGLRDALMEPEGHGRFLVGDWNRDGFPDLAYMSGPGLIFVQNEGRFKPVPLGTEARYAFGGAAFGDLITPGVATIFTAVPGGHMAFEYRENDFPFDLLPAGNEIKETNNSMFLPVIEDLNMDGYPDVFVASGDAEGDYYYVANRGYGSLMMSDKYASDLFPKPEASAAATALTFADFNRDGATDLLMGTEDGVLILLKNETLAERPLEVDRLAGRSETIKQVQSKLIQVQAPENQNVLGAHLEIRDRKGVVKVQKPFVTLMGSGSQSAPEVTAVLREPGSYTISILFPNGKKMEGTLDLNFESPRVQRYLFSEE